MVKKKTKRKKTSTALQVRRRLALERPPVADGMLGVFERMARDPDLTVGSLAELIKLNREMVADAARSAFDAAYREMLPKIPRIRKNGKILNKVKEIQSRYAKYEDIRRVVDPILLAHGFTYHPRTEWPSTGVLEVIGTLEHVAGGKRESKFRTTADESGGKNAIQGLGSGVSYGKRYTLIDLLSIICEGQDDDGKAHGETQQESRRREIVDVVPTVKETDRPAGWDKGRGEPVTEKQLRRLYVIAKNSGRLELEISTWLLKRFGWHNSREVTRDKYDVVCSAIEAPGTLPS